MTVLTGFPGSGRTTLLNRILIEQHGRRIAVIENEFGEVGIDDALVGDRFEGEVFEMNNGCICCTVRGDLIRILGSLMRRRHRFDAILVETTGLADPAPVAQTFFVDDDLRAQLRLDAIITVIDAAHALPHVDEVKAAGVENEAVEQVAFADRIVLNKTDSVSDEQLGTVVDRLRQINALASIHPARRTGRRPAQHLAAGLLAERGTDIFRSKGVLAIAGMDQEYVFQGVHMLMDGDTGRPWGDRDRVNRLVFIGRNLDRAALETGFAAPAGSSWSPTPTSPTGGPRLRCPARSPTCAGWPVASGSRPPPSSGSTRTGSWSGTVTGRSP